MLNRVSTAVDDAVGSDICAYGRR